MDMNVIFDMVDNTTAKIKVDGPDAKNVHSFVKSSMTYIDKSVQQTNRYRYRLVSATVVLYDARKCTFPIGMVPDLFRSVRDRFPKANLQLSPELLSTFRKTGGNIEDDELNAYIATLNLPYELRDYQFQLVKDGINRRRRSFMSCTGSGKSLALYVLIRYYLDVEDSDPLLIVPSMSLVEQMYSDFVEYGWDDIDDHCSRVHSQVDGKPTAAQLREMKKYKILPEHLMKRVVISTWQSLANKSDKFFKRFNAIFVDEAHSCKAEVLTSVIQRCTNASTRIGVSGTLQKEWTLDGTLVRGNLGPVQVIAKTSELIKRGLLTPVQVMAVRMPYDDYSRKICGNKKTKYSDEAEMTSRCGSSEKAISLLVNTKKIKSGQNTVILVWNKFLMERISVIIENLYPDLNVMQYHGKVSAKKREEMRAHMETCDGNVMVATYGTMKQGINIKRIHNIVFAQGSKSELVVKQSIGRGLRLQEGKDLLTVFDLVDEASYTTIHNNVHHNYGVKHHFERLSYYNDDEFPVTEVTVPFISSFKDVIAE
jgi:superfamily II DNA or RNA helicase